MQEWLVFSDYAPESNLIPTFVIVPFFNKFVFLNHAPETYLIVTIVIVQPGLHNLCHPTIRDGSTWSKFGARGQHGDVFPVLQFRCALILRELNQIFIACLFKGSQKQFFPQTLLFTAFLVTVLKNLTYALVST